MHMPVKLTPSTKDYLWGGIKLKSDFEKRAEGEILAECWEISTHPDGPSIIAEGDYKGKTLSEYIKEFPSILGTKCAGAEDLPVLIKLIDAAAPLSIQVHPDDAYALEREGQLGKTEMWYVLDSEPDSELIMGFKEDLTKEQVLEYIGKNALLEIVKTYPVKKGDVIHIEPGTVHAIGSGIVLIEVQQNSNITYRVDDYGRKDKNGVLRPLHIEKAMDVMRFCPANPPKNVETVRQEGVIETPLLNCGCFSTSFLSIDGERIFINGPESFLGIVCLEGKGELIYYDMVMLLKKGDSVFIPAECKYILKGKLKLLNCRY